MINEHQELQNAFNLQQQGRLVDAANAYERLLKRNPNNVDALHYFGILKTSFGEFNEARQLIERSLAGTKPNLPYVENYVSILCMIGDYAEAAKKCKKTIKKSKKTEVLQYVLAVSLYKMGRLKEAIDEFDSLLLTYPNHLAGTNEKASVLAELERYDEALSYIERALIVNPRYPEALLNKGNILAKLKKYSEALVAYKNALALKGNLADAHLGIANIYRDLTRFDEALVACDKALTVKPDFHAAWFGRGNVLSELSRFDEALASYDKALAFKPDFDRAWLARGNVLSKLRRFNEAVAAYDKAIGLKSDLAKAWLGRANVSVKLNLFDDALKGYDKALVLEPALADARFGKGLIKLFRGEFQDGWDLYEWRLKTDQWRQDSKDSVISDGEKQSLNVSVRQKREALIGKKVAILSEQGVGDEIMFASILPDLIKDAEAITYELDPRLMRLFEQAFPSVSFVPRSGNRNYLDKQAFDVVLQAGSLGYAYRRDPELFPRLPYLAADPIRIDQWKAQLTSDAGSRLKIGISWRGGIDKTRRNDRSIDLEQLGPLIQNDDRYFVSLQYGDVKDEIARFNNAGRGTLHSLLDDFNDFDSFAALIMALDLVISVQNTTIHTCGALGKPCWGMIPSMPEWRYGFEKGMTWYSSVALYRQQTQGDWSGVLGDIISNLAKFIETQ